MNSRFAFLWSDACSAANRAAPLIGSGMQFEAFAEKAIELRKEYLGAESARMFSDREEALRWLSCGD